MAIESLGGVVWVRVGADPPAPGYASISKERFDGFDLGVNQLVTGAWRIVERIFSGVS